jgi:hypothetical protein
MLVRHTAKSLPDTLVREAGYASIDAEAAADDGAYTHKLYCEIAD